MRGTKTDDEIADMAKIEKPEGANDEWFKKNVLSIEAGRCNSNELEQLFAIAFTPFLPQGLDEPRKDSLISSILDNPQAKRPSIKL